MLGIDPYPEANNSLPPEFLQCQHRITWPDQPLVHSTKAFNTQEIKLHWKSSGSSHFTRPAQHCTTQVPNLTTRCPETSLQLSVTVWLRLPTGTSSYKESLQWPARSPAGEVFPFTSHFVLGPVPRVCLLSIMGEVFIDPINSEAGGATANLFQEPKSLAQKCTGKRNIRLWAGTFTGRSHPL